MSSGSLSIVELIRVRELDDGVPAVCVVGRRPPVRELDVAAVLQIRELLRDVRDGDEVVGEKRVRHLPHEQRVLVPFRQGPDDVAPDRLVLPDLLLRHVVKVCHGLLSLLCLHPI